MLSTAFLQIAALLNAEYTTEEASRTGLTPPNELAALLEALCPTEQRPS